MALAGILTTSLCASDFGAVKRNRTKMMATTLPHSTWLKRAAKKLHTKDGRNVTVYELAISYFEAGFSERVVAQKLAGALFWEESNAVSEARALVRQYSDEVGSIVKTFPSYFESVFEVITASES